MKSIPRIRNSPSSVLWIIVFKSISTASLLGGIGRSDGCKCFMIHTYLDSGICWRPEFRANRIAINRIYVILTFPLGHSHKEQGSWVIIHFHFLCQNTRLFIPARRFVLILDINESRSFCPQNRRHKIDLPPQSTLTTRLPSYPPPLLFLDSRLEKGRAIERWGGYQRWWVLTQSLLSIQ